MARVLFTSARHAGFVLPMLQLATAMADRGDEVWFLTGEAFRARIEAAGATFVRLPYEDEPLPSRISHDGPDRSGTREIGALLRELFLDPVEADHRAVLDLHRELRLDLVVTEPLFVGAELLALLPREARPAVLAVGMFPLPFGGADVAPYGTGRPPLDGPANRVRNLALAAAADVAVLGRVRRAFAVEVRRLTGARLPGPLFDLPLVADAYAQLSVPQLEYPRRRLSPKVRFVGPLPPPDGFPLPAGWDLAPGAPVVHVTQGTYANEDPGELIVPTIRALAREDVIVAASTGGPDPAVVARAYGGPLPANARVERFLPYAALLPAASAVVTNGGFGSVHHALRFGVPLVVAGVTEEKREVNARVAWSGAGIDLRTGRPSSESVRTAVLQVLGGAAHRRAAARIGAAIAGTRALDALLALADELTGARPRV